MSTGPHTPPPPPSPGRLVAEVYRFAQRDRYGRLFLLAARVGLAVALPPLALLLLHVELRHNPLTEVIR